MQKALRRQHRFRASRLFLRAVEAALLFAMVLGGTARAQQLTVTGRITDVAGAFLEGVSVQVQGTDVRTTTDVDGRYSLTAPADGVLVFTLLGYRALGLNVAGRTILDVIMEPAVAMLEQIIVTGYTEQRRADITGAISSVDMGSVQEQSTASVLQRLDGRVAGVTVDASGSPASRTTIRIRGISSFQNNDPLYIIDGTPVEDSYLNWLNPADIVSMEVLKDAAAASIYGSRATNGVVIIETRKKGSSTSPRFTADVKVGMANPVKGYNSILMQNALDYAAVVRTAYENAGQPVPENIYGDPTNPTVPAYIWPNNGTDQTTSVDESTYSFPNNLIMRGSPGTDWWDAVFGTGVVSDFNMGLSGSGTSHGYNVSFNYLNQQGTAAYNRYQRGSVRANTQFQVGKFSIGENLAVALEQSVGGAGDPGGYAEDGIMGKNILMQPVVPVYDIGGNFAAGKAVGLGNQSNPLAYAWGNKDDPFRTTKIFGNVFAGFDVIPEVKLATKFGFNLTDQAQNYYNPIVPQNSEPSMSNSIGEYYYTGRDWTWTNTLTYNKTFSGNHSVALLLGQEANKFVDRSNSSSLTNLISTDINARYIQDALGATKNVSSSGGKSSLLSYFGKLDYNFAERYYLSGTLRRDGSSRLGPDNRWGTFPAFSVGWRMSKESFLAQNQFFTNIMFRFGYGITGNQLIPPGRIVSQFGGSYDDTYYAINGGNTITPGYRQNSIGNPDLKWEENKTMNLGLDLEFFHGNVSVVVDAYERKTDNLLFDPALPATAGQGAPPIINIGKMKNRGIDFSIGYQGRVGASGSWNVSFNGSHYKNEIVQIDGQLEEFYFGTAEQARYGFQTINRVGNPIGSFYGYIADGFFEDDQAVADHAQQDGAAPGRIRFRDVNGDGVITSADKTIIGSPHPDFTAGLNLGLAWGAFDVSATIFGTFGNDIWEVQKQFYVFRNFSTNVRADLLANSWTPETAATAKYPKIDQNDTFSGQMVSSFYVEDGTYVRLRNLQIGYLIPQSWIPATRVYVQAENLFTLTGYPGLDPALPAADIYGSAGDIRDQYRGVDRGAYPNNRIISFGISATF